MVYVCFTIFRYDLITIFLKEFITDDIEKKNYKQLKSREARLAGPKENDKPILKLHVFELDICAILLFIPHTMMLEPRAKCNK